ncbi:MAG TPA: 2-phospho-L-lactate guanylyltransferase [Anaerolineaceae bacterium]|nr:2-phospho-L-lactate guanylyltransferase [Anaerolineaceae bacterium]
MSLWAIIPVKPLRRGKSRLAGVLTEDERALLNYTMLGNTLKAISSVPEIDQVLVVSRDPAALALAREHGARTVQEEGSPELNTALRRATLVAKAYGARGVMILPADLPLVNSKDIREFIAQSGNPPEIIIAPDRREEGTNALLVSPAGLIDYCFGKDSFRCHSQRAQKKQARLKVCRIESLSLDLDYPEDLDLLKQYEALQVNL